MIEINGTYYAKDTIKMIGKIYRDNQNWEQVKTFEVFITLSKYENIIEKVFSTSKNSISTEGRREILINKLTQ
jgi:hypothetical protein